LRTRVIPERLKGVIATRRYTNPCLPLPYLTFIYHIRQEGYVTPGNCLPVCLSVFLSVCCQRYVKATKQTFVSRAFSVAEPSLEFTAWTSVETSCWLRTIKAGHEVVCSPDIRSVSALEVLGNRTLQIDIYLLTYLLTNRTRNKPIQIQGYSVHRQIKWDA